MRTALRNLDPGRGQHFGLVHDAYAPLEGATGKIPNEFKDAWFERVSSIPVHEDYAHHFRRWYRSFDRRFEGQDEVFVLRADSRILCGHGNPSPTEVGLTVHRTWGVPYVPGSSIKGTTAHYVATSYGDERSDVSPGDPSFGDRSQGDGQRARFRGPVWDKGAPAFGPGEVYRAIFGAPESRTPTTPNDGSDAAKLLYKLASATAGKVTFHDALMIPKPCLTGSPRDASDDKPWIADVLTVHQKSYYDSQGAKSAPNDYDAPNPVSFVTVKPDTLFLFALSGPVAERRLAARLVREALGAWGVGGKTSSGYGRFERDKKSERALAEVLGAGGHVADVSGGQEPKDAPTSLSPADAFIEEIRATAKKDVEKLAPEWLKRIRKLSAPAAETARVAAAALEKANAALGHKMKYLPWARELSVIAGLA